MFFLICLFCKAQINSKPVETKLAFSLCWFSIDKGQYFRPRVGLGSSCFFKGNYLGSEGI